MGDFKQANKFLQEFKGGVYLHGMDVLAQVGGYVLGHRNSRAAGS